MSLVGAGLVGGMSMAAIGLPPGSETVTSNPVTGVPVGAEPGASGI